MFCILNQQNQDNSPWWVGDDRSGCHRCPLCSVLVPCRPQSSPIWRVYRPFGQFCCECKRSQIFLESIHLGSVRVIDYPGFVHPLHSSEHEVVWQYQHWEGQRFVLCHMTIPPIPELWTELRSFFNSVDVDKDGFISKEDATRHNRPIKGGRGSCFKGYDVLERMAC